MPKTASGRVAWGNRKLTDEQVWEARTSELGPAALAERFGVDRAQIRHVRQGTRLRHVPDPMPEQLTVERLIYLLGQHPQQDLIDMETLCIEMRRGFYQDNEPEEP